MTTDKQGASALPHGLPVTVLTSGSHDSPEEGLCLIEAAAYHAGKPHSDHADGVCPVLGAFGRALNDGPWPSDKARTEALGPLVAKLVGTRSTVAVERARAAFLAQRALTVYAPLALDAAAASLERFGIDCAKLRAATLALRERPSLETATAARAAAREGQGAALGPLLLGILRQSLRRECRQSERGSRGQPETIRARQPDASVTRINPQCHSIPSMKRGFPGCSLVSPEPWWLEQLEALPISCRKRCLASIGSASNAIIAEPFRWNRAAPDGAGRSRAAAARPDRAGCRRPVGPAVRPRARPSCAAAGGSW